MTTIEFVAQRRGLTGSAKPGGLPVGVLREMNYVKGTAIPSRYCASLAERAPSDRQKRYEKAAPLGGVGKRHLDHGRARHAVSACGVGLVASEHWLIEPLWVEFATLNRVK